MGNKIETVLEKNRILNDVYNEIYVNKEAEFFKNYKFNPTSIHTIPDYISRNKNGFLVLDDAPFIINSFLSDGHNEALWLLFDNGSKILLKNVENDEMHMELLFQELANSLNIPSARYDIVIINGKTYLSSECFISVDDLIFDYYDVDRKKDIPIEGLIRKAKKINQEEFVKKMLTIDILTNHKDRFPNNFRTIIRDGKQIICPLYDNGLCGLSEKEKYVLPSYQGSNDIEDIIFFLLKDPKYYNWCLKNVLSEDASLYSSKILEEKSIYIDKDVNDIFEKNVTEAQSLILKIASK